MEIVLSGRFSGQEQVTGQNRSAHFALLIMASLFK